MDILREKSHVDHLWELKSSCFCLFVLIFLAALASYM